MADLTAGKQDDYPGIQKKQASRETPGVNILFFFQPSQVNSIRYGYMDW